MVIGQGKRLQLSHFDLVGPVHIEEFRRDPQRYPYPTPTEIKPVAEAFDALFDTIETRTDEAGNVALWNISGLTAAVPQAQQLSAQQVQQAVDRVLDDLGVGSVAGVVEVVDDASGLQGAMLPPGAVPSGGTLDGRIYLFRDGLRDEAETFATIFHELFHLGLSQRIDRAEYRAAMLPFLSDPLVRQYAKQAWAAVAREVLPVAAAEPGELVLLPQRCTEFAA